jgi:DNA-binding PucR family transcriptional regulator
MDIETDDQLEWRDTYFILFQQAGRPTLNQVESALIDASPRLQLDNLEANEDGMFESVLVQAPQDNAALEISYEMGDAVILQSAELAKQLKGELSGDQLAKMLRADARLDVMLFEKVRGGAWGDQEDDEDWESGGLDPSSLLGVVEALSKLTGGLPIDPASGTVMG